MNVIAHAAGLMAASRFILTGSKSKPCALPTLPGTQAAACSQTQHNDEGSLGQFEIENTVFLRVEAVTSESRLMKPRARPAHVTSQPDPETVKGVKDTQMVLLLFA